MQHRTEAVVTAAVVLAPVGAIRVGIFLEQMSHPDIVFAGTTLLLAVGTLLPIFYYLDTGTELGQLKGVGGDQLAVLPANLLRGVQATVMATAALVLLSAWVPLFGLGFVVLKSIEFWGAGEAKKPIRAGLDKIEAPDAKSTPTRRHGAAALRSYYFGYPWDLQLAGEVVVLATASSLAAYSSGLQNLGMGSIGQFASATAMFLAFLGNEILAFRWRRVRDRALPAEYH